MVDFFWIALACAGIFALLPLNPGAALSLDPVGVAYAMGAALYWALYIVFGQRAGTAHGPRTVAIAVSILPLGIGVAILSSAIPYGLEMYVLTRLPARTFGTLLSLEPAFAAVSGLLLLNESLSSTQWAAIAAIVMASAGVTASSKKKTPDHAGSESTQAAARPAE